MTKTKLEKLPKLIDRKIYKTGQTRGATNQEIYQNRVGRNSTVLFSLNDWKEVLKSVGGAKKYESGYIVLIPPKWYFEDSNAGAKLKKYELTIGENALLFYQRREEWKEYGPDSKYPQSLEGGGLISPTARRSPLGGNYLARIHGTTSNEDGGRVDAGYTESKLRGAGIRHYEYASKEMIDSTRIQLEAIFWSTDDSLIVARNSGMSETGAAERKSKIIKDAQEKGLWDTDRLKKSRILNENNKAICPFCLEQLSAKDFEKRGEQVAGRETWDITITEISLFHIEELRPGLLQHKPYNLGWGHHYCNVVVKDAGIEKTLNWVDSVLKKNLEAGWNPYKSNKEASFEAPVITDL